MQHYTIESSAKAHRAIITCSSRSGYGRQKDVSLKQFSNMIDTIHKEISAKNMHAIPCMITEGMLVAHTLEKKYHVRAYTLEFLWSPRYLKISKDTFFRIIIEYAERIGKRMQQKRMYIDFGSKTIVLKRNELS